MVRSAMIAALFAALPLSAQATEKGFILKAGEGEPLQNGNVVKASPLTGTESAILVEQTFPRGGKTVPHVHDQGDELFYVTSGSGSAYLNGETHSIAIGDVVFVPRGAVHQIKNLNNDEPLVVVYFMSTPELVEQFRVIHERTTTEPERPITKEEMADIERLIGGGRTVEIAD